MSPSSSPREHTECLEPLPEFTTVRRDGSSGTSGRSRGSCSRPKRGVAAVSWIVPDFDHSASIREHSSATAGVRHSPRQRRHAQCRLERALRSSSRGTIGAASTTTSNRRVVDRNGYGLRVPALTISPYAKRGYIDHQTLSFDAYLRFVEDDFLGGRRLDPRRTVGPTLDRRYGRRCRSWATSRPSSTSRIRSRSRCSCCRARGPVEGIGAAASGPD